MVKSSSKELSQSSPPSSSRRGKKRPRSEDSALQQQQEPQVEIASVQQPARPNLRPQRIIVLGAGVSGLACSRELKQRGYEVLVVEARSRVGGRLKGELLELGADYPSTLPDLTKAKKKPGRRKKEETSEETTTPEVVAMTRQHPVDVGGALIHGIENNPIHHITTQMGVPMYPVSSDCLLMDENGWPFDPKVDEKVSNFFNECLDVTFALAEQDRESKDSFGKLFETVCREKVSSGGTAAAAALTALGKTKNDNNNKNDWETPLLKWHRSNLELPSGASFYDLGHTWNDDEPYGFDGDHAAVEPSWKLVMEHLSEGLDILKNAPVAEIRVVLPNGTTPLKIEERVSPKRHETIIARTANANVNSDANSKKEDTNNATSDESKAKEPAEPEIVQQEPKKRRTDRTKSTDAKSSPLETVVPAKMAIKRRNVGKKSPKKAFDNVAERRFSRRQRNVDVNVRCSSRSTKGRIQRLEFDHDWDQSQRRKKRGKKNDTENDTSTVDIATGNGNSTKNGTATNSSKSTDVDVKPKEGKPVAYDLSSAVQVTLRDGTVLEADALVCTLPLGVLKLSQKDPCHVRFVPSLGPTKQTAIRNLGCGLLNKCAISFPTAFWQDSDFLGQAESQYSYLVLNAMKYTQKPVLIFMYGGDFAKDVEGWTDKEIVEDCLEVLRKICGGTSRHREIPAPVDYCITRWGKEEYSRMAFTCIPPGVDGSSALRAIGQPVYDPVVPDKPLIMFGGEHTTPYHPSTMHGAFLSGIREAYRFDLFLEPLLNNQMKFDDRIHVYKHTFPTKRLYKKKATTRRKSTGGVETTAVDSESHHGPSEFAHGTTTATKHCRRRGFSGMTLRSRQNSSSGIATAPDAASTTLSSPSVRKSTETRSASTKPEAAAAAVTSRRSQRSLGASRKFKGIDSRIGNHNNHPGDRNEFLNDHTRKSKSELKARVTQQEDRNLARALASYGKDCYSSLLQSHILPVYGSTRKRNAKSVSDHWKRLQEAIVPTTTNVSSSTAADHGLVQSWLAKYIVQDSWDIHCARIAADATAEIAVPGPNTNGLASSSATRRSQKGTRRRTF